MEILDEVAATTSKLIDDKRFFKATMCKILNDVASHIGVHGPTSEEAEQIRSGLSIKISFDGGSESYMQCAAGNNQIFISDLVRCRVAPTSLDN